MEVIARYRGCLLGLAVGDALGTTLEFTTPGSFEPVGDQQHDRRRALPTRPGSGPTIPRWRSHTPAAEMRCQPVTAG